MIDEPLYDTAKLIGFNQFDDIVYSVRLPLHEYYDGDHPWDSDSGVLDLKLVRMEGRLYAADGKIYQRFESAFSPDTGEYIGGWIEHEEGDRKSDGIFARTERN